MDLGYRVHGMMPTVDCCILILFPRAGLVGAGGIATIVPIGFPVEYILVEAVLSRDIPIPALLIYGNSLLRTISTTASQLTNKWPAHAMCESLSHLASRKVG